MAAENIESAPLQALFWRDEILQLLYWMDGEGLGSRVTAAQLLTFLHTSTENLLYHLQRLLADGYLETQKAAFTPDTLVSLSGMGKKEAGRQFADAFQGMQKAGHGECGPDCEFCYGPDGSRLENCVHACAGPQG